MRYVLQHYRRAMIEKNFKQTLVENLFQKKDSPINWNMKKIAVSGIDTFWEAGYIHRGRLAYQQNPIHTGFSPSFYFERTSPPTKYWWCRDGDWLPYWSNATIQRATLVKEIRAYWANKWFGETIPKIKQTLLDTTKLPEDIIEIIPEYFEYPYEIKKH